MNVARSGQKDSVSNKKCVSCTKETNRNSVTTQTSQKTTRNHPFTARWVLQRVWEDSVEKAKTHLRVWAPKRYREYSDDFVTELRRLKQDLGVEVMTKLKREKGFVRGTKGNSLTVETVIQDLEGVAKTTARTLIDSGSTGSCIDSGFAAKYSFTTHKAPVSVTVYNADGSINECGKITEYVEARLSVGISTHVSA